MCVIRIVTICCLINGLMGSGLTSNPSIIVVGSGPSGIAVATKLLKNNFTNLQILEAENRIGGRIHSIKFGDAFVDLGAQFCHGQEGSIVYDLVKDLDVLKHSTDSGTIFRSNGEIVDENTEEKILKFAESFFTSNETKCGCENVTSVGECLDINLKSFPATGQDAKQRDVFSDAFDWTRSYLSCSEGPLDLHDLNITTEFKDCEGDLYMHWNGHGYKTILEVMMQKYPSEDQQLPIDDKILLNKNVSNITNWQNGGKVTVTTTDGSTYEADHVIFTPSVGVLKAKYESLFEPHLPEEKIDAIKNIGFGAIMKVILHFPVKWWEGNARWGIIWTAEDKKTLRENGLEWLINLFTFEQGENNPNVLIAWYGGGYIPFIESLSEEKVLEGHEYLINKFFAPHYNTTMPDKLIKTTWHSNPNFLGTYSYNSVKGHSTGGSKFPEELAKPLTDKNARPTILFAGEATHPYYFATVHGAIESGHREADRLIRLYESA